MEICGRSTWLEVSKAINRFAEDDDEDGQIETGKHGRTGGRPVKWIYARGDLKSFNTCSSSTTADAAANTSATCRHLGGQKRRGFTSCAMITDRRVWSINDYRPMNGLLPACLSSHTSHQRSGSKNVLPVVFLIESNLLKRKDRKATNTVKNTVKLVTYSKLSQTNKKTIH